MISNDFNEIINQWKFYLFEANTCGKKAYN